MQVGLQTSNFRIADVRSVEESEQVETAQLQKDQHKYLLGRTPWSTAHTHGMMVRSSFHTNFLSWLLLTICAYPVKENAYNGSFLLNT